MRALILFAGALLVAGCSNNDQHDNTANVDENLTAENIVSNDVTAIDAVTGDASNMAAAAEINDVGPVSPLNELSSDAPTASDKKPSTAKPVAKTEKKAKPAPSSTAATATTNSSE